MTPALWLAWRDVARRRGSAVLTVGVVAAAVALCAGLELTARARELSVAADVDRAGPPLRVVPRGLGASAAARLELGDGALPPNAAERVRGAGGADVTAVDGWLVTRLPVNGVSRHLLGVPAAAHAAPEPLLRLEPGEAALGSELAGALQLAAGAFVEVGGRPFRVAAVLPTTASTADGAVYLRLEAARAVSGREVNELRVYLRPGADAAALQVRLAAVDSAVSIHRLDRGAVADRDLARSLAGHRRLLFGLVAAVALAVLLVAAHLDAAERRLERAVMLAMGASPWLPAQAAIARAVLLALLGAGLGLLAALAIAAGVGASGAVRGALDLALACIGAAGVSAAGAAAVASVVTAARDLVTDLQES